MVVRARPQGRRWPPTPRSSLADVRANPHPIKHGRSGRDGESRRPSCIISGGACIDVAAARGWRTPRGPFFEGFGQRAVENSGRDGDLADFMRGQSTGTGSADGHKTVTDSQGC